ncbi:class I SAM-dependent methyltransferase [Rubritalea spongiae]|uniref:Class I SAM-dependent methyltransferase n=1 Tax=Rubritalea spongiae TaxID=430797 RepID=A0ABW5E1S2_9BACT
MYQSLEASLHDLFWASESHADESHLLENFLQQQTGPSLEIGCGSGRLMLPLLEKGYQVEGVEIASDMVELLHKNAKERDVSPLVHHCAIEEFQPTQTYSSFAIPAFTLQLLSRASARQVLRKLRDISSEQTKLYLTLFIPWAEILDELEIDTWYLDKETQLDSGQTARCFTKHQIDRLHQTLYREHRYELAQQTHLSSQTLQWYFLPELINLLESSGWTYQEYDADFQKGNHDTDASVITVYATAS